MKWRRHTLVERNRSLEHLQGLPIGALRVGAKKSQAPQQAVVGSQAVCWPRHRLLEPCLLNSSNQRRDDGLGDFLLHREDVVEAAIIAFRPEMHAGRRLDQLRRDPHTGSSSPHAPFKKLGHTKLPSDLGDAGGFAAEGERGIASDHEQRAKVGQPGDDVLGDPVTEIGLIGLAAEIIEGEHGD